MPLFTRVRFHCVEVILFSCFAIAFRTKIRTDISKSEVTNDETSQQQAQFLRDVANVLRRNVVQGTRVKGPEEAGGDGVYSMWMY